MGKRCLNFLCYTIYWSCFPAGIARREGFYAPPAEPSISLAPWKKTVGLAKGEVRDIPAD